MEQSDREKECHSGKCVIQRSTRWPPCRTSSLHQRLLKGTMATGPENQKAKCISNETSDKHNNNTAYKGPTTVKKIKPVGPRRLVHYRVRCPTRVNGTQQDFPSALLVFSTHHLPHGSTHYGALEKPHSGCTHIASFTHATYGG